MATKPPSAAVQAARDRRSAAGGGGARIEWFTEKVVNKIDLSMKDRVRLATEYLLSRVTRNISVADVISKGPRGGRVVTGRSKPGEFPHVDYGMLLRTTFSGTFQEEGEEIGFVGTPLDYGLVLETSMDRSFLVRTLNEEQETLTLILTETIK